MNSSKQNKPKLLLTELHVIRNEYRHINAYFNANSSELSEEAKAVYQAELTFLVEQFHQVAQEIAEALR